MISEGYRSAALVVLGLTATAASQIAVNPPGGVWQVDPSLHFSNFNDTIKENTRRNALILAGTSVLAAQRPLFWSLLIFINGAVLLLSVLGIICLLPRQRYKSIIGPVVMLFVISWYLLMVITL